MSHLEIIILAASNNPSLLLRPAFNPPLLRACSTSLSPPTNAPLLSTLPACTTRQHALIKRASADSPSMHRCIIKAANQRQNASGEHCALRRFSHVFFRQRHDVRHSSRDNMSQCRTAISAVVSRPVYTFTRAKNAPHFQEKNEAALAKFKGLAVFFTIAVDTEGHQHRGQHKGHQRPLCQREAQHWRVGG